MKGETDGMVGKKSLMDWAWLGVGTSWLGMRARSGVCLNSRTISRAGALIGAVCDTKNEKKGHERDKSMFL